MNSLPNHISKCLIIHPAISKFSSLNYIEVCKLVGAKYPTPPLGLLTVAALLPREWEIKLVDANVEPLLDWHITWADLVFTGGIVSQQLEIFALIARVHSLGRKIVVGGPEPTSQPYLYAEADFLVKGEGENTVPLLLEDLARGIERGVYSSAEKPVLKRSPVPRFDLIDFQNYLMMGIQTSRGCPYNCEFCNIIEIFGRSPRNKTSAQVLDELQFLFERGWRGRVFFVDDNFFGNRNDAKELLLALGEWSRARNYPFYFSAEAAVSLADDAELLELAEAADFRYISIGIETPDNAILKKINKNQNVDRPIPEVVQKFLAHGMAIDTSLIMGLDGENAGTADAIIQCLQDSGICMAMIGTLYALPGTQLWRRLKDEGRLVEDQTLQKDKDTDIDQMTSGLNFQTSRPKREILRDYVKVLAAIYEPGNYYRRLLQTGLNLRRHGKHHPNASTRWRLCKAFLRVCAKTGFDRPTGRFFWSTLGRVLLANPSALETVIVSAALYMHLRRHAQFIIELTRSKLYALSMAEKSDFDALSPQGTRFLA